LFHELHRILITGGKITLIVDNKDKENIQDGNDIKNSNSIFHPFHALLSLELIKMGFIMRGDVIWKKNNQDPLDQPLSHQNIFKMNTMYKHIMIYSKDVMGREKKTNIDTVSRDQFLQYTKSIWKHQPELINELQSNLDYDKELFDSCNHLLQLYSFESDKILFLFPRWCAKIMPIIRHIRKKIIEVNFDQLFK
jgi:site-specific DNA-methyltransferase (adenine-specific)